MTDDRAQLINHECKYSQLKYHSAVFAALIDVVSRSTLMGTDMLLATAPYIKLSTHQPLLLPLQVTFLGDAITPDALQRHVDSVVAVYTSNGKHTNVHFSLCGNNFLDWTVPIPVPPRFIEEARGDPDVKGILRAVFCRKASGPPSTGDRGPRLVGLSAQGIPGVRMSRREWCHW